MLPALGFCTDVRGELCSAQGRRYREIRARGGSARLGGLTACAVLPRNRSGSSLVTPGRVGQVLWFVFMATDHRVSILSLDVTAEDLGGCPMFAQRGERGVVSFCDAQEAEAVLRVGSGAVTRPTREEGHRALRFAHQAQMPR